MTGSTRTPACDSCAFGGAQTCKRSNGPKPTVCSRTVRSRLEYTDCGRAICGFCVCFEVTLNAWLSEHEAGFLYHRSFIAVIPPNVSNPPKVERDCNCIEDQNAVDHCSQCFACKICINQRSPTDALQHKSMVTPCTGVSAAQLTTGHRSSPAKNGT